MSVTGPRMPWTGSKMPQSEGFEAESLAFEVEASLSSSPSLFRLRPFFNREPPVPARCRVERPARRQRTRSLA